MEKQKEEAHHMVLKYSPQSSYMNNFCFFFFSALSHQISKASNSRFLSRHPFLCLTFHIFKHVIIAKAASALGLGIIPSISGHVEGTKH